MTETYEPTKQSEPMHSIVKSGLRNASTDNLIEELGDRDLSLHQAASIRNYIYPIRQETECDCGGE